MTNYKDTLLRLGLNRDPFQYQYSDTIPEDFLEETWIEFTGCDAVLNLEQSSVLLAPPGGGKTAWRRYMEKYIKDNFEHNCLVVIYNKFDLPNNETANSRDSLIIHRDPLLRQIARTVFGYLQNDNKISVTSINEPYYINWWYAFLYHYLPNHYGSLIIKKLSRLGEVSTSIQWDNNSNLQEILLDELLPALSQLGISRLYLLLDNLDGLLQAQNENLSRELIDPLVNALLLLSNEALIWKFFVPDSLEDDIYCSSGYKTRRFDVRKIKWDIATLTQLLELRLDYASEGRIRSIDHLLASNILQEVAPTRQICQIALTSKQLGPPRELLKLGTQLLKFVSGNRITEDEWADFLEKVSDTLTVAQENKPPQLLPTNNYDPIKLKLQLSGSVTGQRKQFDVRIIPSSPNEADPSGKGKLPFNSSELIAVLKAIDDVAREYAKPSEDFYMHERETLRKYKLLEENEGGVYFVPELLEAVGKKLYASLLYSQAVRQICQGILSAAHESDQNVLIQLRFDGDATTQARYPWELLHNDKHAIGLRSNTQIVRYITDDQQTLPLEITSKQPIRLLYIQSRPKNLSYLHKKESETVLSILKNESKIKSKIIFNVTWETFTNVLSEYRPHILHFDGHGEFGHYCETCVKLYSPKLKKCDKCFRPFAEPKGYLAFEDKDNSVHWISSTVIGQRLDSSLRLAVLSACRSSVVRGSTLFGGLSPSLIRAGVPSVVGMQLPISFDDAAEFATGFYKSLAKYGVLPQAVKAGRQKLIHKKSWFIPVLYLRSKDEDGRLFTITNQEE